MAKSITYSTLNVYNPDYNELECKKLQILYQGGRAIEENAHLFIHRENNEFNDIAYQNRLKCTSYRNYFVKIVTNFVSDLLSKSFAIVPASDASDSSTPGMDISLGEADKFWREFAANTDLRKHNLAAVLSNTLTDALVCGRAYIGVDFPKIDVIPIDRAQENALGTARAYTISIPVLSVIDWAVDDFGKYTYVILKNETIPRKSFTDKRDKKITQFKIWEKDPDSGVVKYSIYEIVTKIDKEPKKDDPCFLVDEGTVSFKDIPVLCLEIPDQLWIGNLIGGLCAEHFRRTSALVYAMNRNLFSIPFYQQGPELPSNGDLNTINQNVHRGNSTASTMRLRGFAVGSTDDKLSFVEPTGTAYDIIDQQLKELVDSIKDVTNQMGDSIAAKTQALARSGLSKQMDNHSKELVLSAYANLVKDFALNLYSLISEGRNEDIIWSAKGMSDFKVVDREALILEATQINLIRAIAPSRTWYKHNAIRLINEVDQNLSPQEQITIQDEINKYYDSMPDEKLLPVLSEPDSKDKKVKDVDNDNK
jgi:hypothetical protein